MLDYAECIHSPLTVLGLRKYGAFDSLIPNFTTNCAHLFILLTPYLVPPSYFSDLIETAKWLGRRRRRTRSINVAGLKNFDRYEHRHHLCYPMADFGDYVLMLKRVVNWWFYAQPGICDIESEMCEAKSKGGSKRMIKCPSTPEYERIFFPAYVAGSHRERKKIGFEAIS